MIINPQILWGPIFHINLCLVCFFDDLCTAVHETCFTIFLLNNIRHCLTKIQHIHIQPSQRLQNWNQHCCDLKSQEGPTFGFQNQPVHMDIT